MRVHLDTDFLVFALAAVGPERERLTVLAESDAEIQLSAVAWYEFTRGPRTPEQLAAARTFLAEDGIVAFAEDSATQAAEVFRRLGSPRRRAADIAVGVTAVEMDALLLTRKARDFAGIPRVELESVTEGAPRC